VVPTILGANMFLSDFVSTMWFSTCCVHPARIGSRGRTQRQTEWDHCSPRVAILVSRDASAHRKPQFHPHKQLIRLATFGTKKLLMQKTIRSVDATVRIVDGSVVLLENRCIKMIWQKEIPITRGYEYDLRDCRRVGLITPCETTAQLRAAEIRFVR
jgi:hypothetical protein